MSNTGSDEQPFDKGGRPSIKVNGEELINPSINAENHRAESTEHGLVTHEKNDVTADLSGMQNETGHDL